MHFGRTDTSGKIDYTLPGDHGSLGRILGGNKIFSPRVYVGGVLWSEEKFKGLIYPEHAKAAEYLKYYTGQFTTIELNSTHYRVPPAEIFDRWKNAAPEGFKFCPKIHQSISHADDLLKMIGLHNAHNELFECLEGKLGNCFMQLPPHFSPHRLNELLTFLDNSEVENLAIELRHEDWFKQEPAFNLLCNYLYKNNVSLVITDTPGRRDVAHMRLTNKTTLVRFKAVNDERIDQERVKAWILRAKAWFDAGLEEFYFFIHTADKSRMPFLALFFIEELQRACGIVIQSPRLFSKGNDRF